MGLNPKFTQSHLICDDAADTAEAYPAKLGAAMACAQVASAFLVSARRRWMTGDNAK